MNAPRDLVERALELDRAGRGHSADVRLSGTRARTSRPPTPDGFSFDQIIGKSSALRTAVELARKLAPARTATVLLIGETGTGKELFARGLHYEGRNASAPFVAINCAAIPETLLESELFGHEAGAFTGAQVRKHGLMELAGSGTLFLDEVQQLPGTLQAKLLRVLEDRRVRRLGGTQEIAIDCRIIAASNVSLEESVQAGQFREDLFYRLNVLRLDLPPLRERSGDVEVLARHFLAESVREHGHGPRTFGACALAALRAHHWPGNIRELRNVVDRAALLSGDAPEILAGHLLIQRRSMRSAAARNPEAIGDIEIPREGKSLLQIEWEAAQLTLQITHGNQSQAARILGISRPTLARIIRGAGQASTGLAAEAS